MTTTHAHFKRTGWFYWPASWLGYVIAIALFVHTLWVAKLVNHHIHSLRDAFYVWFPFACCTFLAYEWLAKKLQGNK